MNLNKYLVINEITINEFAKVVGVAPHTIYSILKENMCYSTVALKVILATNCEVSFMDLFPKTAEDLKDEMLGKIKKMQDEKNKIVIEKRKRRSSYKTRRISYGEPKGSTKK